MYPILMLFICTAVVTALFMFVVPRIVEIFKKQGAELPVPTKIMIAISDFMVSYWYLVFAAIIGLVMLARWYYKQPQGRAVVDRLLLRVPIAGPLYLKISTARFARTLGTLLSSGVGLLTGIDITKNIVANVHLVAALESARDGVREGKSLARELGKSGYFPSMLSQMIAVGEQSGELENMLNKAGKAYENEVNATLSGLTSLLEPLMMIGVGGVVLCIVISVLLPMADLIRVVQT
jgi:general secretion pathway protein F